MMKRFMLGISFLLLLPAAAVAGPSIELGSYQDDSSTITVPVVLTNQEGVELSAIGLEFRYNGNALEAPTATVGQSASAAGKRVIAKAVSDGVYKIAIYGTNQNTISDGTVASVTVTRKPGATSKNFDLQLTATASDKAGNRVKVN